jgi:hypothetical protein
MNRTPPAALLAITTVVAAIGSLTSVSPAQAYPSVPLLPPNACFATAGYQFPGGGVTIDYPGIGQTRFTTPAGTHVDTSAETFYQNGTSLKGTITGDITKGSLINLTVTRGDKYPPLLLSGAVNPDNKGHGSYTFENHDTALWDMLDELACQPGPLPPPVLPPGAPAPLAPPPPPASAPPPPAALTAAVTTDTDLYDKPNDNGDAHIIGQLTTGQVVKVAKACSPNAWCTLTDPAGAAWGRDLRNN